jgi:hypothetical protein
LKHAAFGYLWVDIMVSEIIESGESMHLYICIDNPNTIQTLEYTKDKYNVKMIK